jgi:hypothetical protein
MRVGATSACPSIARQVPRPFIQNNSSCVVARTLRRGLLPAPGPEPVRHHLFRDQVHGQANTGTGARDPRQRAADFSPPPWSRPLASPRPAQWTKPASTCVRASTPPARRRSCSPAAGETADRRSRRRDRLYWRERHSVDLDGTGCHTTLTIGPARSRADNCATAVRGGGPLSPRIRRRRPMNRGESWSVCLARTSLPERRNARNAGAFFKVGRKQP